MVSDLIEKSIDRIFDIGKKKVYLIGILLLGVILRLTAAINLSVSADDMHFVTHAVNFLGAGKLVTYDQSSGLWFAFTSVAYKIFGYTQFSSRFAAILFGSFSIFLIYLLSKEFFSEKVSLTSAFLLAVAPFHIKNTVAEMDVMAMFFVLFGMLFFVRALKREERVYTNVILSGIGMGLAIYTKVYPLFFIPSLLIFFFYIKNKEKKEIFNKQNIKLLILFLAVIFVFTIPALTHNYLLYKDKGFMDLQFTRTLGLGKNVSEQYYGWDAQFDAKNSWSGLFFGDKQHAGSGVPLLWVATSFVRQGDPIVFYLGIIGLILILWFRKDKEYTVFLGLSILFILPFLASIILLPKHFIFMELLLIPLAAFTLVDVGHKISRKNKKDIFAFLIAIVLIFSLIFLGLPPKADIHHFYGKSSIGQVIDFKNNEIDKIDLVIVDSRIYRGRIHWMFFDRPYMEASDFPNVLQQMQKIEGEPIRTDVYYIECVPDDCGWGTIKNQPDFNNTMEQITNYFKSSGSLVKTISEPIERKPYYPIFYSENKEETIKIYKTTMNIKLPILQASIQPKNWFLYPIGYEPIAENFDNYKVRGVFDNLLNDFAHWMVWISVLLAFFSLVLILYLIIKE